MAEKPYVVECTGNYTGMVFVYGPYHEADANKVLNRMLNGQTMHTTKLVREHRADDVIFCPEPFPKV